MDLSVKAPSTDGETDTKVQQDEAAKKEQEESPFTFHGIKQQQDTVGVEGENSSEQRTFLSPDTIEGTPAMKAAASAVIREPTPPADIVSEDSYNPTPCDSPAAHAVKMDEDSNLSSTGAPDVRATLEPFKPVDENAQPPTAVQQGDENQSMSLISDWSTPNAPEPGLTGAATNGVKDIEVGDQSSGEFSVTMNGLEDQQSGETREKASGTSEESSRQQQEPEPPSDSQSQSLLLPPGETVPVAQEEEEEKPPADKIFEYQWPQSKGGEYHVLQEQISEFLGVLSFKRKYPDMTRRLVVMQERIFLQDAGVVTEMQCDLGLWALKTEEVCEMMQRDYPDKYQEFVRVLQERERERQKERRRQYELARLDKNNLENMIKKAIQTSAKFNAELNRERKEERRAYFDLQTNEVHYPLNLIKKLPPEATKVGAYPVALIPGQYQDHYKPYTPDQMKYFPVNTALYDSPKKLRSIFANPDDVIADSDSEKASNTGDDKASESGSSSGSGSSDSDSSSGSDDSSDSEGEGGDAGSQAEGKDKKNAEESEEMKKEPGDVCSMCTGGNDKNKQGDAEELVQCSECKKNSHPSCAELTDEMIPIIKTYPWQCMECKTCVECMEPHDEDKMMFCDHCDRGYHTFCVGLRSLPKGRWECKSCKKDDDQPPPKKRRKRTPKAEKTEDGAADSDAGGASPKKFTSLKQGRKPGRKGRPPKSEGSTREGSPVEGTLAAAPGTPASTDGSQAGTEGETPVVKRRRGRKPKALLEQEARERAARGEPEPVKKTPGTARRGRPPKTKPAGEGAPDTATDDSQDGESGATKRRGRPPKVKQPEGAETMTDESRDARTPTPPPGAREQKIEQDDTKVKKDEEEIKDEKEKTTEEQESASTATKTEQGTIEATSTGDSDKTEKPDDNTTDLSHSKHSQGDTEKTTVMEVEDKSQATRSEDVGNKEQKLETVETMETTETNAPPSLSSTSLLQDVSTPEPVVESSQSSSS